MATRLKTIEFCFPVVDEMADATPTNLTQITLYIPEFSGTVTFKSVMARMSCHGAETAAGDITQRVLSISVNSTSSVGNTTTETWLDSGEQMAPVHVTDCTAHFVANWTSGTTATLDGLVRIDGDGTYPVSSAWRDICVTIEITYEYDDTQTTQIKTVWLPLNWPTGTVQTSLTNYATIPNLSTRLPEASKTFRSIYIVAQGNQGLGGTADSTLTFNLDSGTHTYTTNTLECALNASRFLRFIYDLNGSGMSTSSTHTFGLQATTVARYNHMQCWMVVTYEFDASSTTEAAVSLKIPMELASPFGLSAANFQRGTRSFYIEEGATITTQEIAYYVFWDQRAAMSGLNFRLGTGSFVTYTDQAAVLCGGNTAMVRNDSAFTLARGLNTVNFDCYNTDAADVGYNVSGFWLINYNCGVPTDGVGAINHTVMWHLGGEFEGAAAKTRTISAVAPSIPDAAYFVNAIGINYQYQTNSTGNAAGVGVLCEKTAGEGGLEWLTAYADVGETDPEVGLRQCWAQTRAIFKRWPSDPDASRLDVETPRRWVALLGNGCTSFDMLDMWLTYHAVTFTVAGDVSGSNGGTVELGLHRADTGELVLETSRSGDGAYSFTWYDDTEDVYVVAYEDDTHLGRSAPGTAV